MSRVPKEAEESNAIPTAKTQNNNTAFTESVSEGNVFSSSGEEQASKTHGFSKTLAEIKNSKGEVLGYHAAIILRYLSVISRKYGKNIEGKRWVRVNLDHISEQYPYMGRSTIDENVLRLEQFGCCEIQNAHVELKKRKNDRTRCYHIPRKWMDATEDTPRYFNSAVARAIKVPAAVIYYNFCHWIGEARKQKADEHVKLSPAAFVELLPFSESTIKRALKTLAAAKYIQLVPGEICLYSENTQELRGSKADDKGSNPDEVGSKADEKGPNPDNYIDCNIVDKLETNSKPKPAASVFEKMSDDTKANDEPSHSFTDGIAPCADEQARKEMEHGKVMSGSSDLNASQEADQPRSFSPFDAEVPFRNAPDSDVHAPSTADSADEVESVGGKWPMVDSLTELHQINHDNAKTVENLVSQPETCEMFRQTIINIWAKTMGMLDLGITDMLYASPDGDEIIEALLPPFHQFLDQTTLDPSSGLSHIIYHAALECMVGAFLWPREKDDSYNHPMHSLISVTYKLHLVLWRREENARLKTIEEERTEWCREYASVDERKENDADLSPAEKMRVFRNALNSKNKVGWIWFDQTHQTHRIQVSTLGLQRIQKLFELNPDLTPADLLPIMDGCMNEYCGRPAPPRNFKRGVHWHARMGHRLHIFAGYLETIVKQLGMKSPVEVYLNDAVPTVEEEEVMLAA